MLSNPIVKKKPNIELSIDTVRDRMKSIGYDLYPVPLEKDIQDVTVTRQFMSDVYGGSSMETSPKISEKKLALHGLDDFMYLNLNLNPQAPQFPGAPGLFFDVDSDPGSPPSEDVDDPIPRRLFSRLTSAIWLYCGQYEIRQVLSLTKEEWAIQSPKVRNAWATQLCIKGWGFRSRARIHLRQTLRREPTTAELMAALTSGNEYKHIRPAQFSEAFLRGQETMAVYTMKCVGYDTAFQRNLAEKFPTWVPPPSKTKGEKKTKAKKNGAGGKLTPKQASKANSNKRKQEDLELSDSEVSTSDEVDYSENDQEGHNESGYVPRGTRSRPIQLE
ncbi:hypothetical protein BDZ94DRAFT_1273316 [Collybia nuda]|uniref:DUF6697 domain-containing protein n=1 Tax=Collybia nuda TaxID=64659 RepID=A0A9P6C9P7_9AGAR|nr:hypothetical protein BDZ94DRAFT_1273316 [Collybia nuda]